MSGTPSTERPATTTCACGAVLPRGESEVVHRYIRSTPECWGQFGTVLAREYETPPLYAAVHQRTTDAYAAQHPRGQPAKSLSAHLVSLCVTLRDGEAAGHRAIKRFVEGRTRFPEWGAPDGLGPLTIVDVARARSSEEHCELVARWSVQVWQSWSAHHAAIAALVPD